jgi:hypothetical protein
LVGGSRLLEFPIQIRPAEVAHAPPTDLAHARPRNNPGGYMRGGGKEEKCEMGGCGGGACGACGASNRRLRCLRCLQSEPAASAGARQCPTAGPVKRACGASNRRLRCLRCLQSEPAASAGARQCPTAGPVKRACECVDADYGARRAGCPACRAPPRLYCSITLPAANARTPRSPCALTRVLR